ncbi:hypothetical protein thsrh120_49560 [Rhizobium sp. No.120]
MKEARPVFHATFHRLLISREKREVREGGYPGQVENSRVFHIWDFREEALTAAVGNVDKIDNASLIPDLSPEGEELNVSSTSSKD